MPRLYAFCLFLIMSGCGYSFQGGGSILPPGIKTVQIPLVQNDSTESRLTVLLTESLRDEFERYGVLGVVDDSSEADAILKARILKLERETSTVTAATDTALQYETSMTVAAELRSRAGEVLWRNKNMRVSRSIGGASSVVVTSSSDFAEGSIGSGDLAGLSTREVSRGQEHNAFQQLSQVVARKMYEEAVAPEF